MKNTGPTFEALVQALEHVEELKNEIKARIDAIDELLYKEFNAVPVKTKKGIVYVYKAPGFCKKSFNNTCPSFRIETFCKSCSEWEPIVKE